MENLPQRREGFIKSSSHPEILLNFACNEPLVNSLEKEGLIPEVLAVATNFQKSEFTVVMEKIEGFSLDNIPEEQEAFKFSVGFAQDVAKLFVSLKEQGAYHGDIHSGNVMYDTQKERFVFVDLEELTSEPHSMEDFVFDYTRLMVDTYFGVDIWQDSEELRETALREENIGLLRFAERHNGYDGIGELFYQPGALYDLAGSLDLTHKINPDIMEFLSECLASNSQASSFDSIFGIPRENQFEGQGIVVSKIMPEGQESYLLKRPNGATTFRRDNSTALTTT